ncbi:MAG: hypothetical protein WBB85_00740, partial [Albidovulum sp.]|uniref:hypothetical protein n=1 Tax=Albidovulum sp. TaxID=1872424 RepID=UPI003C868F2B
MLETTNHNDWLEAEITRIAALHKGERNPAVVKLVAEAKARGYPQKKADVDKMVKAASRAAKDDRSEMTSEDAARSREFTLEPGATRQPRYVPARAVPMDRPRKLSCHLDHRALARQILQLDRAEVDAVSNWAARGDHTQLADRRMLSEVGG